MKPLLVGEANPYGGDPDYALYPHPRGCAGHRLCERVMGLTDREYLDRFDRVNLCPTEWSMKVARSEAERIVRRQDVCDFITVLLGARVCAAFMVPFEPFQSRVMEIVDVRRRWVVLPHPSGLSRAWNAPGAYDRARAVLREAGVLPCSS